MKYYYHASHDRINPAARVLLRALSLVSGSLAAAATMISVTLLQLECEMSGVESTLEGVIKL